MFAVLHAVLDVSDTHKFYIHRLCSTNVCIGFQVMFKIEDDVEGIRESVCIGFCVDICLSMYVVICMGTCADICTENVPWYSALDLP